ncbi:MAG TPA: hypothetical protein VIR55_00710 [Ignavibacteria bacterium]
MGLASDSRDYAAIKNKTSRSLIIKEYEKKMLLNLYNPLKIKCRIIRLKIKIQHLQLKKLK